MIDGWIKIHRNMMSNPVVCKDADHLMVWMYLLTHAVYKDCDAIFEGQKIRLKPGQFVTGRKKIAQECGLNESKTRRILDLFENDQQIDQQKMRHGRLISILNWEKYQDSDQQNDQQMTNKWPTSDQQVTTKEERKKERNKRERDIYIHTGPSTEEVKEHFKACGYKSNPYHFYHHHNSNGWDGITDWQSAAYTWEQKSQAMKEKKRPAKAKAKAKANDQGIIQHDYDMSAIEALVGKGWQGGA